MCLKVEVIISSQYLHYCQHGEYHRVNGPAMLYQDGTQFWYRYSKLHRDGGPAIVSDGISCYFQYGKVQYEIE
jgi:hypothetical protein